MEGTDIVKTALGFEIANEADNQQAAEVAKELKRFQAEIEKSYRPIVDAAHKAWKAGLAELQAKLEPFEKAEKALKAGMLTWAKAERERLAEEERKRQEAERKRKEEEALAEAELLSTLGDAAGADAALEAPIIVKAEAVEAPKAAEGTTIRELWSGECFDFLALVKAVAEGRAPIDLLKLEGPVLNRMARELKQTMRIDGCRAVVSESVGVRV